MVLKDLFVILLQNVSRETFYITINAIPPTNIYMKEIKKPFFNLSVFAVALSQSAFASMLRFLGEPCMGVVSQIIDLDNSSTPNSRTLSRTAVGKGFR
ncbi:hypothetical protein [uncultured Ruminococcus sp.]|uniref:hypothetical protein n=1 Tax=uncultured Ruminococcus sp. TaxID=165186 RepID=UPI00292F0F37|nr:hypothetical protein [uncultured Ruminococcus sp.]